MNKKNKKEEFWEGKKTIGLDSETDEIVINPGLYRDGTTRIPQQDFLNICSDFAFKYIASGEFAKVASDYIIKNRVMVKCFAHTMEAERNEKTEVINKSYGAGVNKTS